MGKTFENLTMEELCDLMCGGPEPEPIEEPDSEFDSDEDKLQQTNGGK